MIAVVCIVAGAGLWVLLRRRRASTLAGLDAGKPVFSVEPARRRVHSRSTERL